MKKGSVALRLFLYASLVSLVWLGGYVLLSGIFAVQETAPEAVSPTVTPEVRIPETVLTEWSALAVVNEEREVTSFFFRYADFAADTLVFIEVPTDTKTELETGGYEVLKVHHPEMPKLFMISDLCSLFSKETWCMAVEEVGVALLGVRPRVCYVMEEAVYKGLTETVDGKVRFATSLPVKEMIAAAVQQAVTDTTLREEMVYLESYRDVDTVLYKDLPGEASAEEFRPALDEIRNMVERFRSGNFSQEEGQ